MKVSLIYLAAGNSRRFGANKLWYPLLGKPLYRHLLERLAEICERHEEWELVVVTRYERIFKELETFPARRVFSEESVQGISRSIRAGLQAAPDADAWSFFTADQPYLTAESAEGFLTAMEREACELGCVAFGSRPGNPAWFAKSFRSELLSLEGDKGGRQILKKHPDRVRYYQILDERELDDLDYPPDASENCGLYGGHRI